MAETDAGARGARSARTMSEEFRAAATTAQQQVSDGAEATVERIRELNERALVAARSAGGASLDAYEKALQSVVSVQERLAEATQVEWVKAVVGAQAEFLQNISGVYVNATRDVLDPGRRR